MSEWLTSVLARPAECFRPLTETAAVERSENWRLWEEAKGRLGQKLKPDQPPGYGVNERHQCRGGVQCGTRRGYDRGGRCLDCTGAKRAAQQEFRALKKLERGGITRAKQEAADALAVRVGGRVTSRRSGTRGGA